MVGCSYYKAQIGCSYLLVLVPAVDKFLVGFSQNQSNLLKSIYFPKKLIKIDISPKNGGITLEAKRGVWYEIGDIHTGS